MLQSTNDILVIKGFAVAEMLRTLELILIAFFHIPPKGGKDFSELCTIYGTKEHRVIFVTTITVVLYSTQQHTEGFSVHGVSSALHSMNWLSPLLFFR